jgi:hypothetical protein
LASTLVTLHIPLLRINYQIEGVKSRAIGYFDFEDTPELRDIRNKYNQSLLLVEPKLFISTLQSLKSDVVNFQNNPNSECNKG